MKTLKKSFIALMTIAVLFGCKEDDLPTPAGSATNDLEEFSTVGGISIGDQTSAFDIDNSSDNSGQEKSDDSKKEKEFILGNQ